MRHLLTTISLSLIMASIWVAEAHSATPSIMNYQGYLTDASDVPIDGEVNLIFAIYDDPDAVVTPIWEEGHPSVLVTDGRFDVVLGQGTPSEPLTADIFDAPGRWLGITVGTNPELRPRFQLMSVPYSFQVGTIDGALGGTILGRVMVNPDGSGSDLRLGWGDSALTVFNGSNDPIVVIYERSDGGGAVSVASTGHTAKGVTAGGERVELGPDGLIVFGATESDTNMIITTGGDIIGIGQVTMGENSGTAGTASTLLGLNNVVTGDYSAIGGGADNVILSDYAAIAGGFGDTIGSTGHYSYLFGISSNLEADSTFMVDMPHIRFGDETSGYEFPTSDTSAGLVLGLTGPGQLGWIGAGGGGSWTVTDSVIYTDAAWGLARGGAGNVLLGSSTHTMVNLGYACTTGTVAQAENYCIVSGGQGNAARVAYATIGGGAFNVVAGWWSAIGGGRSNYAYGGAQGYSVVGGGYGDSARGDYCFVGSGNRNIAAGNTSAVVGGSSNLAQGDYSFVGGGDNNTATDTYSLVAGGYNNMAIGFSSTVGGGRSDTARGSYSTVAGGQNNEAVAGYSTIAGGSDNLASGQSSFVGGGTLNNAAGVMSTVGGGMQNNAGGDNSVIPGGLAVTLAGSADYSMAFGRTVTVNNAYRVAFFDDTYPGRLGLNRNDAGAGINYPIHVGTTTGDGNGAHLTNGGTWTSTSSRSSKDNFEALDGDRLLASIAGMQIDAWNFKNSDERHIGPVSEDFVAAFDVGTVDESDGERQNKHLAAGDVAGVALAGVKELVRENAELKTRLDELERLVEALAGKE